MPMPELLLPGTSRYDNRARFLRETEAGLVGALLHTIKVLWKTLRALNSEVTQVAWMAWMDDEEIRQVREALDRVVADA